MSYISKLEMNIRNQASIDLKNEIHAALKPLIDIQNGNVFNISTPIKRTEEQRAKKGHLSGEFATVGEVLAVLELSIHQELLDQYTNRKIDIFMYNVDNNAQMLADFRAENEMLRLLLDLNNIEYVQD